ncbi:MAG: type I phosphomannose isomerase catalytic subunit [Kiritimatiellales bacterium]
MEKLYPLRFVPVYKDYIWGGSRIPQIFHRNMPAGTYAESWEISTHPDGATKIANGPLAGKTLTDLLPAQKNELLGTNVKSDDFPLLIKLIDARENLSVQVHPNDATAAAVNGQAKSEMWYFLGDAEPAYIYCGLKSGIGKTEFMRALENKTFADILQKIPVKQGGAVYVPGGRVHAIGEGCLILEIQQNSNTTYRVYDWDRVDAAGKSRELHINQALQVIDWEHNGNPVCTPDGTTVCASPYFRLAQFKLNEQTAFPVTGATFHALFIAAGGGKICWNTAAGRVSEELLPGQSWLIPAVPGEYSIAPETEIMVLQVTVP